MTSNFAFDNFIRWLMQLRRLEGMRSLKLSFTEWLIRVMCGRVTKKKQLIRLMYTLLNGLSSNMGNNRFVYPFSELHPARKFD